MASATATLLTMTLKSNSTLNENSNSYEFTTNNKKRRKQSKPSRIQSTDENSYQQYATTAATIMQQQQTCSNTDIRSELQQGSTTLTQSQQEIDEMDLTFPLNLSSSTTNATLKDDATTITATTQQTTTFYGNYLTNQLSQQIILPNFKRLFNNSMQQNSNIAGTNAAAATTIDSATHRIFNPEAFCDLCNKEFCNKYFLKTHKANKHGIYMENLTNIELPMLSNYYPIVAAATASAATTTTATATITTIAQTNTTKKMQQNSSPSQSILTVKANSLQMNNLTASSMRALCNICQREFCNKYFVRRHKAKIHGIVEQVGDDGVEDLNSIPGPSGGEFIKKELTLEDELEQSTSMNNSPHQALSLLVSSWSNDESKDSSKSPERITNKKSGSQINASSTAFCEICCKEYCNKYFLRVHKQKCHGFNNEKTLATSQPMPLNLILRESNSDETSSTNSTCNQNAPAGNCICSICPATFPDSYLMKLHYEQVHKLLNNEYSAINEKEDKNEVQKLHTMIMNLQQEQENFCCEICNKDLGNLTLLENHIVKEHSSLVEELSNGFNSDYGIRNQFLINTQDSHKNFLPLGSFMDEKLTEDSDRTIQHTPTSSFCEICKKELCNKYFMKTHMQRMHGISIENGAQIGGVVCDICNKELCSKYFLRVHKQNSHGIVEESLLPQVNDIKQSPDPLKPQDSDLQHRYFSHFTEVCTICSRRFRSVKWLKAHLLNDHGDEGREKWKDMQRTDKKTHTPSTSYQEPALQNSLLSHSKYQCSYCPFVTPILALLLVHERGHLAQENLDSMDAASSGEPQETLLGLRCPRCQFSTSQLDAYNEHMNQIHGEHCPPLLNLLKDTILHISSTSLLPAVYSLPTSTTFTNNIGNCVSSVSTTTSTATTTATCNQQYIMQPFLLEDPSCAFITTLIYLPVKDRLSQPITTSFRLTPT
ncbi:uncharacterized protein [Rhodnius prolixus]|uniref:uncharacterized protein n=1 Tax=Rhodnius prolixus TaxID=13249 RepID=UPI003D18F600